MSSDDDNDNKNNDNTNNDTNNDINNNDNENVIIEVEELKIPGLYYVNDIKEEAAENIITELDKFEWVPLTNSANSRLVQHYGYKYDYKTYNIKNKCDDIPECLMMLKNLLTDICLEMDIINEDYVFNQCIVNNYLPGQGISRHTDVKKYGGVIGCFTLGGGATMTFKNNDHEDEHLYVAPNSVYIMSKDARYLWTHEMISKKIDIVDNIKTKRERRISVTFRNVPC